MNVWSVWDRKGMAIVLVGMPILIWVSTEPLVVLSMFALGSIPIGYLILYGKKGSGGRGIVLIGVSNAFRNGGNVAGVLTLAGEVSKALIPIGLAMFLEGGLPLTITLLMASIIGTCYSPWLGFKGGGGTTIFMWSMLLLSPLSFVILIVSLFLLLKAARFNPMIVLVILPLIPITVLIVDGSWEIILYSLLYIAIFLINHQRWLYELEKARSHLARNSHFLTR